MALPDSALSYLDELAADIAQHGGLDGKTFEEAISEAHARRQAFAIEMQTGATLRSKMGRKALNASVCYTIQRNLAEKRLRDQQTDSVARLFVDLENLSENAGSQI